jgi:hypothetical protein
MTESHEIFAKGALSLLAILLLLAQARLRSPVWRERIDKALLGVAVVSVAAWTNFGTFHGGGRIPHHWEQFHYFLGSKYFAELGYDGIYVASMGAEMQSFPGRPFQPWLRDLRTNEVVSTMSLEAFGESVHRRFTPERWAAFKVDNAFFVQLDPEYLARIRTDHGYNPTPAWTFVAQVLSSALVATPGVSLYLALVDVVLLVLAFVVFFRAFGRRIGVLALIVYCTGYGWRYWWTGGAFLRQDWFAAVLVGFAMLETKRYRAAGALFAYATLVRVFPLMFVVGLVAQGVRDRLQGRDTTWLRRVVCGFALAAVLLVGAGSLTGRGAAGWTEFAANLQKHSKSWLTNNVGLRNPLLYDGDTYHRRLVDWSLPEPWTHWQTHMDARMERFRWPLLIAAGVLGLLALAAALRGPPAVGAAVGPALVFAASALTCYYWGMLVVALVRRHTATATAVALLAVNLVMTWAHFETPAFELRYGVLSWALLVFFVGWLLAGGGWREMWARRAETAEPTARAGAGKGRRPRTAR